MNASFMYRPNKMVASFTKGRSETLQNQVVTSVLLILK